MSKSKNDELKNSRQQKPQGRVDAPLARKSATGLAQAVRAPNTASAALRVQRAAGNRATGAAIQRFSQTVQRAPGEGATPEVGMAGGEISGDLTGQIERGKQGGRPLDDNTASDMGNRFGADFSNVRVHTGAESNSLNRSLSAKAFTHGSDVFFSSGSYSPGTSAGKSLLAHELTHVIQQSGGGNGISRVARKAQAKLTVGAANDEYEREADAVASRVMRMPSGGARVATSPVRVQRMTHGFAVQRLFGKKDPEAEKRKAEKKQAAETEQSERLEDGRKFERNLGKYAFNRAEAMEAAQQMGTAMKAALFPEFKAEDDKQKQEFANTFGGDATKYAGNVGKTWDSVNAVFQEGNLRERMTALYNAMFGGFKTTIKSLIEGKNWEEAEKRGLDVRKLKIRKRQMKWNPFAKDIYRDPRGGVTDRKDTSKFDWDLFKGTPRQQKAGNNITDRKVSELDEGPNKAGLSEREKNFMFKDKVGQDVSNETLPWEEGGSKWEANDNSKWVQKSKRDLKMPVFAGPSGTSLRFFQMYEWMKKPTKPEKLRLALLGWMLTENDHSFHEIMSMSEDYGLPYKPGQEAYRDVKPLSLLDLRKNVCLDAKYPGLFPDEVAYHRKLDAGGYALTKPYLDTMNEGSQYSKLAGKDFRMDKAKYEGSGMATMMRSVTGYTLLMYQIQNIVANSAPWLAKMRINMLLSGVKKAVRAWAVEEGEDFDEKDPVKAKEVYAKFMEDDGDDGMTFGEKNVLFVLSDTPDITAEALIEETKDHNAMTQRAMQQLPKFKGMLYRGEANFMKRGYKKGSTFTLKKFMSAATHPDGAVFYANQSAGTANGGSRWYSKYMKKTIIEMETSSARDITAVSGNEEQDVKDMKPNAKAQTSERVLLPGTRLRVETDPTVETGKYEDIPVIKLKEVSEGSGPEPTGEVKDQEGALQPDQEFETSPSLPLYRFKGFAPPTPDNQELHEDLMDQAKINGLKVEDVKGEWLMVSDRWGDAYWAQKADWIKFHPLPGEKKAAKDNEYLAKKGFDAGNKMGDFDRPVDKDSIVERTDKQDIADMPNEQAITTWITIRVDGDDLWATVYDFRESCVKAGLDSEVVKDVQPVMVDVKPPEPEPEPPEKHSVHMLVNPLQVKAVKGGMKTIAAGKNVMIMSSDAGEDGILLESERDRDAGFETSIRGTTNARAFHEATTVAHSEVIDEDLDSEEETESVKVPQIIGDVVDESEHEVDKDVISLKVYRDMKEDDNGSVLTMNRSQKDMIFEGMDTGDEKWVDISDMRNGDQWYVLAADYAEFLKA